MAFVHSTTNFLRLSSSAVISCTCGCISGSPPAIDTIGAPHSSTAAMACSTGIRCLSSARGLLDLAAARALEVARVQRLELHDQRVLLDAAELLLHQVRPELHREVQRHRHGFSASIWCASAPPEAVRAVEHTRCMSHDGCMAAKPQVPEGQGRRDGRPGRGRSGPRRRRRAVPSTRPTPGRRWSPRRAGCSPPTASTAQAPSRSSPRPGSPAARCTTTSATRRTCSARPWPRRRATWRSG